MPTVTIRQAKTSLSRLIERACAGEEVIIARGKVPIARLVPLSAQGGGKFGAMRGKAKTGRAFFEPLLESETQAWEP